MIQRYFWRRLCEVRCCRPWSWSQRWSLRWPARLTSGQASASDWRPDSTEFLKTKANRIRFKLRNYHNGLSLTTLLNDWNHLIAQVDFSNSKKNLDFFLSFFQLQSNLWTTTTLGTLKSGRCSKCGRCLQGTQINMVNFVLALACCWQVVNNVYVVLQIKNYETQ